MIFTFHGVGEPARALDPAERDVWLEKLDDFRRMLDVLAEHPGAEITFDDGNASDVTIALPELQRRGLVATFFLLPGLFGAPGFVDEGQARGLADAGMPIGSHGMMHRPWRRLAPEFETEEFVVARKELERVCGGPVDEVACPFGAYDRRAVSHVRSAGYKRMLTSDGGPSRGSWLEARNSVHAGDTAKSVAAALRTPPSRGAVLMRAAKRQVKRWR